MYKMYDINNEQQKEWDSSHLTPTTKKTHHVIIPTVVLVHLTRKWCVAETACLLWLQEHLHTVNEDQIANF